jgi:ribosome-binding factor A
MRQRSHPAGESQRQLRVGEQIRHTLADLLMRGAVHDPILNDARLTVSEVRTTRDLRRAEVFVIELGGGLKDETRLALQRATPFLRGEVTRRSHLKYAPELVFTLDESFAEATHIEDLIARERAAIAHRHPSAEGEVDDGEG